MASTNIFATPMISTSNFPFKHLEKAKTAFVPTAFGTTTTTMTTANYLLKKSERAKAAITSGVAGARTTHRVRNDENRTNVGINRGTVLLDGAPRTLSPTISTEGQLLNRSEQDLTLEGYFNVHGKVVGKYADLIPAGQAYAFAHVSRADTPEGSEGGVVYRVTNADQELCYWYFAWNNPPEHQNEVLLAYTTVSLEEIPWDTIEERLNQAGPWTEVTENGFIASAEITKVDATNSTLVLTITDE